MIERILYSNGAREADVYPCLRGRWRVWLNGPTLTRHYGYLVSRMTKAQAIARGWCQTGRLPRLKESA